MGYSAYTEIIMGVEITPERKEDYWLELLPEDVRTDIENYGDYDITLGKGLEWKCSLKLCYAPYGEQTLYAGIVIATEDDECTLEELTIVGNEAKAYLEQYWKDSVKLIIHASIR